MIDALFGTGFHGAPRAGRGGADRADQRVRRCRSSPSTCPSGRRRVDRRGRRRRRRCLAHRHVPREQGRSPRRARPIPRRRGRRRRHRAAPGRDRGAARDPGRCCSRSRSGLPATPSSRPARVLVVGGAPGTTGAPVLAAMAALRADAGYVTVAVPARVPRRPSRCWRSSRSSAGSTGTTPRRRSWPRRSAPTPSRSGRGSAAAPRRTRSWRGCSSGSSCPSSSMPTRCSASSRWRVHPTVLTPHAGELARLLDRDSAWVDAHRLEAARECAERYGAVVAAQGRRHDRAGADRRARSSATPGRPRSPRPARATS